MRLRLLGSLLAVGLSGVAAAQGLEIDDLQTVSLRWQSAPLIARAKAESTPVNTVSFEAFGKRFDIDLQSNDRLTARLTPNLRTALGDIELLRGTLVGHAGSWVRLTRSTGRLSGMIWDGTELYGIAPRDDIVDTTNEARATLGATVIYRSPEMTGALGDLLVAEGATRFVAGQSLAPAVGSALVPAKQIDIGLVGDYEFVQAHPSSATARLLEIVNNVDAIFVRHLGVYLNVVTIELFDTDTDPFTTDDPNLLLVELANHKETTPELRVRGLVHLFTRRDLAEPPTTTRNIVGIANLGSVCDVRTSVALTQATFAASVNSLIAAHEIGHNFGAPHDGEPGSPCASTPTTFLMAPTVNTSDEFSACSIEQMQPEILGAGCLTELPLTDVAVVPGPASPPRLDLRLGGSGQLVAVVENTGATEALAVDVDVRATGIDITRFTMIKNFSGDLEYTCVSSPHRCHIPRLPPGKPLYVIVDIAATTVGSATLGITARTANDAAGANDSFDFAIDVQTAVDVDIVDPVALQRYIRPLDTNTMRVELINRNPVAATDVRLTIDMVGFVPLEVADPIGDGCTRVTDRRWSCAVGTIPGLTTRLALIGLRAPAGSRGGGVVSIGLRSAEPDVDLNSDGGTAIFDVVDNVVDLEVILATPPPVVGTMPVELTGTLTNRGPDTATMVEFWFASPALPIVSVTSDRGQCSTSNSTNWVCRIPALGPSETATLSALVNGVARSHYRAQLSASATEADANDDDNIVQRDFQLLEFVPPPAPAPPSPPASGGGGGGGGAIDLWSLLWLLALLVSARGELWSTAPQPRLRVTRT